MAIAQELRNTNGLLDRPARERQVARIGQLHATVGFLAEAISASLGEAQRAAQTLLLAGMLLLAGALLVAGVIISHPLVAQDEKLQETRRENEAQLRPPIETAPLPPPIPRAGGPHPPPPH